MSSEPGREKIPYWNVNVPPAQWTVECPDYLAQVDESDRKHLGVWDDEYHVQSWAEVKEIAREASLDLSWVVVIYSTDAGQGTNRLEQFKRLPSQLHEYRRHMGMLKAKHGSVMDYIVKHRVRWDDLTARGKPFEYQGTVR